MLDPISDMITRIRNAQMAGHSYVLVPASKVKLSIAKILEKKGFLDLVKTKEVDDHKFLDIALKYEKMPMNRKKAAISSIKRVSKEGQRIYVKNGNIRKVKNGFGIAIISTSKGIMTGEEAYSSGLGGEYICEVW